MDKHEVEMIAADSVHEDTAGLRIGGQKQYELKNHLGNVLAVVTDRVTPHADSTDTTQVAYYAADILNVTDYTPFGATMPGRSFNTDDYRSGFLWWFFAITLTTIHFLIIIIYLCIKF